MQEVRVESWAELEERLFENTWRERLGRNRSNEAFRGRGSAEEGLETTLQRLGGNLSALERQLLRNFRKYARRGDVPYDSTWNWLALGKHHGLPTRLLDWTFSPYVALHFATASLERYDEDGVVWAIDYVRAHELVPAALRSVLDDEGANVFTAELLERSARGLRDFDLLVEDDEFVIFLEPPSLDERIVNQYALFLPDVLIRRVPRRVGRTPRRPRPPARHPGRAEVADPGQARPGEHHGASPVPGPRRPERVAAQVLPPPPRRVAPHPTPPPWVGRHAPRHPRTRRRGYRHDA